VTAPTISVIIPTWNRAATLRAAVESALAQSLPVLEVLVCDDGSTDGSQALVDRISARDPRTRWLDGPRAGRPAIPRNRGIRASRGEWLAFLDSDDAWLPNKLAVQLEAAGRLRCDAVCSNAVRLVAGIEAGSLLDWKEETLNLSDLLQVNRVICSSSVVRRSLMLRTGGFPESAEMKAIEDYGLWLRIATLSKIAYCADPLVRYNDDPVSSVRSDQGLPPRAQKSAVLANWRTWLRSAEVDTATRLAALARGAMASAVSVLAGRA
jgi:glycosyltransferase involved in cell wall biosynthesis